jgi:photosystem II stability/assembly factor-like uncharacterized protein
MCFVGCAWPAKASGQASYPRAQYRVNDVFFADSEHGWAIVDTEDGRLLARTTDGGDHWSVHKSRSDLFRLFFLDPSHGWALSVNLLQDKTPQTTLYATDDGGQTWELRSTLIRSKASESGSISDFVFLDSEHGFFVGEGAGGIGLALETRDGGKSIQLINAIAGKQNLSRISAPERNRIWIFGANTIVASFDGGKKWSYQMDSAHMVDKWRDLLLNSGVVQRSGRGWAAGSGPAILATTDWGKTWRTVFERADGWYDDVSFWDAEHGCAVGASYLLDCTTDGGRTWFSREILPHKEHHGSDIFSRILLTSPSRWWILAEGGFLFQSDDGGGSWKEADFGPVVGKKLANRQ